MRLVQWEFHYCQRDWFASWTCDETEYDACSTFLGFLETYWEVDLTKCKMFWLSLYTTESRNRIPCDVIKMPNCTYPVLRFSTCGNELFEDTFLDVILKRFMGKKLYVELQYQEK